MLWSLSRVSSSSSSTPKPGAQRTSVAPRKPPSSTTTRTLPASFASFRRVVSSPRGALLVVQLREVAVVVKHGGVVHVFQDAVHAFTIFPAHIVEAHGNPGTGLYARDHAVGAKLAIVDRKYERQLASGG